MEECGGMNEELGLASALEGLRDELEEAWRKGRDRAVRFQASEVSPTRPQQDPR